MSAPLQLLMTDDGLVTTNQSGYRAMRELLLAYEAAASAAGAPTSSLNPGISRPEIERTLLEAGLPAPEEIVAWFEWHNGVTSGPKPWATDPLGFVLPISFSDAVARYRSSGTIGPHWAWAPGWLRLGSDPTALAVQLTGAADQALPAYFPAVEHETLGGPAGGQFRVQTLSAVVAVYLDALQRGVFYEDWRVNRTVDNSWGRASRLI